MLDAFFIQNRRPMPEDPEGLEHAFSLMFEECVSVEAFSASLALGGLPDFSFYNDGRVTTEDALLILPLAKGFRSFGSGKVKVPHLERVFERKELQRSFMSKVICGLSRAIEEQVGLALWAD